MVSPCEIDRGHAGALFGHRRDPFVGYSYLVEQIHHLTGCPAFHPSGACNPDTDIARLDVATVYVENLDLLVRSRPFAIVTALQLL